MDEMNYTDYENYTYDDEELIIQCHFDKHDRITGINYIVICCFSFLGNSMLLYALVRYEDLKRVTMFFLLCLSIFDMLFTMTLPFWAYESLHNWIFGDVLCKILIGAYFIGMYGGLIVLTAMTVDCFIFVIVRSNWYNRRRRLMCARAAFAFSCAISIGACLKDTLSSHAESQVCKYRSSEHDHVGYYTQFVMLFAIPLVIIILCYGIILHTLMSSTGRRRYKTLMVVMIIIMAFVICWGPYHIVIILLSYFEKVDCKMKARLYHAYVTCRILAYFHCCINPLLFLIRGRSRKIFCKLLCCQSQSRILVPSERSSDPSHFNLHRHLSMASPQNNITELKSI